MSFIKMGKNLDDVQEDEIVPEDEYVLEIKYIGEDKISDNGRTSFPVGLVIADPDHVNAAMIFHTLAFPKEEDFEENDGRTGKLMLQSVKRFFVAFDIPWTEEGFDKDDLAGAQGSCGVTQGPRDSRDPNSDIVNLLRLARVS